MLEENVVEASRGHEQTPLSPDSIIPYYFKGI
jgi:hypothetical protein